MKRQCDKRRNGSLINRDELASAEKQKQEPVDGELSVMSVREEERQERKDKEK